MHEFKTEMKADMKEIKEEVKEWKEFHDDLGVFVNIDDAFDNIRNFTYQRIDGIRNDTPQRLDTFKAEIMAAITQSQKDLIFAKDESEELKNNCESQEAAAETHYTASLRSCS
jgi:hypothetical protein